MEELVKATGRVTVQLFGPDGQLKEKRESSNLVVTAGKTALATWLAASSQVAAFMPYIGIGTGSTPPSTGDTALQTELSGGGYSRIAGTISSASNAVTNSATFPPTNGTGAITEAGLFSASTSGTLFAHNVFAVINKQVADTLVITWTVSFN